VFIYLFVATVGSAQAASLDEGQESRAIKSLSPEEITDYLSGNGMGLAKAAELNGYPGPAHVLGLAGDLELTTDQRSKTESLFRRVKSSAIALGEKLVEEERVLDHSFATGAVAPDSLASALARISRLQGEIRRVHLDAHLQQRALLTPSQIEAYMQLRGYRAIGASGHSGQKQH
jgi:hypothetical protein